MADDGLVLPGNIDLHSRPRVRNADGSISTVRSMSVNMDGNEVLIPTVAEDGSRLLSDDEAVEQYRRTGQHLGMFSTPDAATAYAEQLHRDQEAEYVGTETPMADPQATPLDMTQAATRMIRERGGAMNAENLNRAMQMLNGSRTDGDDFIKEIVARASGGGRPTASAGSSSAGGTAARTSSPAMAQDRSSSSTPTASGTPMDIPLPPDDPNSGVRPDASIANLPQLAEAVTGQPAPAPTPAPVNRTASLTDLIPSARSMNIPEGTGGVVDPTGGFDPGAAFNGPERAPPMPNNSMLTPRNMFNAERARIHQEINDPNSQLMRILMGMGSGGLRQVAPRIPMGAAATAARPPSSAPMPRSVAESAAPYTPPAPAPAAPPLRTGPVNAQNAAETYLPPGSRSPGAEAANAPLPPGFHPDRFANAPPAPPPRPVPTAQEASAARPPPSGRPTSEQASAARPPTGPQTPSPQQASAPRPPVEVRPTAEQASAARPIVTARPTAEQASAARPPNAPTSPARQAPTPNFAEANAARPPLSETENRLISMFRRRGMKKSDAEEMARFELENMRQRMR